MSFLNPKRVLFEPISTNLPVNHTIKEESGITCGQKYFNNIFILRKYWLRGFTKLKSEIIFMVFIQQTEFVWIIFHSMTNNLQALVTPQFQVQLGKYSELFL